MVGTPHPSRLRTEEPEWFGMSRPLVRLSEHDALTLQDAFEGVHIFGGLGSGKTSGSGQTLAHAFLRAGFGGIVLTAKPDEVARWLGYCDATGRRSSLIAFGPGHPWRFDFIDYEMRRPGRGRGIAANLVSLFEEVLETSHPGKVLGGDPYWREARGQLLRNAIDLVRLSMDRVDFDAVAAVIRTAPRHPSEITDPAWKANSVCARLMLEAFERIQASGDRSDRRDFESIGRYFFEEFAPLDPEPRSSVVSMVGALTDTLLRGEVRELLMSGTNIVPELTMSGSIILLDMPVQEFRDAGRFVQVLFKTMFQRMIERQHRAGDSRPVFLWADEAQFFTTSHDTAFQTTARSSRTATVYLSQNLPNYYDSFGADSGGRDRAKKLLGAFGLKIFHANGDPETNKYAEELFGQDLVWRESYSQSTTNAGAHQSNTQGTTRSVAVDHVLRARELTELRRGGPHGWTDAILFRSGNTWTQSGRNLLRVRFPQRIIEERAR